MTVRVDVWAYGMVMYESMTRVMPFEGCAQQEIMMKVAVKHELPDFSCVVDCISQRQRRWNDQNFFLDLGKREEEKHSLKEKLVKQALEYIGMFRWSVTRESIYRAHGGPRTPRNPYL